MGKLLNSKLQNSKVKSYEASFAKAKLLGGNSMNQARAFDIRKAIITVIMFAISLVFLLPFFWMLVTSFKIESDVFIYPIQWLPRHWNVVENYKEVWSGSSNFALYYWNSVKVTVLTTLISCTTVCGEQMAVSHCFMHVHDSKPSNFSLAVSFVPYDWTV
jgi:ABC-type maltose transport system permease subunit